MPRARHQELAGPGPDRLSRLGVLLRTTERAHRHSLHPGNPSAPPSWRMVAKHCALGAACDPPRNKPGVMCESPGWHYAALPGCSGSRCAGDSIPAAQTSDFCLVPTGCQHGRVAAYELLCWRSQVAPWSSGHLKPSPEVVESSPIARSLVSTPQGG